MTLEQAKAILAQNGAGTKLTDEQKRQVMQAAKVVASSALKPPVNQG